jgi:N4-gp56 family major capsid protein
MADVYTTTGAVDYSQAAYDRYARFAFRPERFFDAVATVKPTAQSMPGSSVIFPLQNDLAVAITPLSEVLDVSAVAISDTTVTVTLVEYGNATISTAKLRGTSYLDVGGILQNVVGFNAAISQDTLARNSLALGTNVAYAQGAGSVVNARANLVYSTTVGNFFGSHDVRAARAFLRRNNVPTPGGGAGYVAYIDPDVAVDLQEETGAAGWRQPHDYSAPDNIWQGELGLYEGVRFIETPRAVTYPNAGSGSANVYRTIVVGDQALAKAHSSQDGNGPMPRVVEGPVVDKLRRFVPYGWYWLGGYGVYRQSAIYNVESTALLGGTATGGDHLAIDA